jgi:hypothetical protein
MKKAFVFPIVAAILACILAMHTPSFAQSNQPPEIDALIHKLIASDTVERNAIMEQLDRIQDPNVLVPPVLAALDDVDPNEAWKLLDILARFPGAAKPAPLVRLARRAGAPWRMDTLKAQLISLGEPARVELFKSISEACTTWKPAAENPSADPEGEPAEPDNQARDLQNFLNWAAGALAETGSAGLENLLAMLHGHDACRRKAAQAGLTAYLPGNRDALDPRVVISSVSQALADSDTGVQEAALKVVECMIDYGSAKLSPAMIQSLFVILKGHPDVATRFAAYRLLLLAPGNTPKKAAEIASRDPDENIQDSAYRFLHPSDEHPQP